MSKNPGSEVIDEVSSFDIECEDWEHFVVGAVRHEGVTKIYWREREMIEALLELQTEVWTWNGGRYDTIWLARGLRKLRVRAAVKLAGKSMLSLTVGKLVVRDGFRLWPVKLATAAKIAGLAKSPTQLPCRCGRECGGYCSIKRRGMPVKYKNALEEYVAHDTLCTSKIVPGLRGLAAKTGIKLGNTVGSSAWKTMHAWKPKRGPSMIKPAVWKASRDYAFCAKGYHGGRAELFQLHAPRVTLGDINSAYPAALTECALPVGDYQHVFAKAAERAFRARKPGIYHAFVHVPEGMHVPPLPVRDEKNHRLVYPTGRFTGTWPLPELIEAKRLGTKILMISEAVVWKRAEKVLRPFMQEYWGHRAAFGKDSPEGNFLKWFLNSGTGKFGQKPESQRCVICPRPEEIRVCDGARTDACQGGKLEASMTRCCRHACRGTCKRWTPLDRQGTIWAIPQWLLAACSHVEWAAYLTAHNRIRLGRQWRAQGKGLAYGDTDSCYTTVDRLHQVGKKLGQWSNDGKGLAWRGLGPKAYEYAKAATGEWVVHSKGVHVDALGFDRWALGDQIELEGGVWGFLGGARRDTVFEKRVLKRSIKQGRRLIGSRKLNPDGRTTRSITWQEYMEECKWPN